MSRLEDAFQKETLAVLESLDECPFESDEYSDQLEKLEKLADIKKTLFSSEDRLSKDSLFTGMVMLVCVAGTIVAEVAGYSVFRKASGFFTRFKK